MFNALVLTLAFLFLLIPLKSMAETISCASLLSKRHQASLLFITKSYDLDGLPTNYMKSERKQIKDVIQAVLSRYKQTGYFVVPPLLEVHFQGFWYNFNYEFRRIRLPLIVERSNQMEEVEMVPDLELRAQGVQGAIKPAYEPKVHRYKITEQISSVVHEIAHSILDEKIRLEIPEFREVYSLFAQLRKAESRRDRFVELLKPPDKDFDSWTDEDSALLAAKHARADLMIENMDKQIMALKRAIVKFEHLPDLLLPYTELFADLAAFEYTKSGTAMIENISVPGEPVPVQMSFRLFQRHEQSQHNSMVDGYTLTAPTRSWIPTNLIGNRDAPSMQDMQIVAEAIVQELKQRVSDPSLHNLDQDQLNTRFIERIKTIGKSWNKAPQN